MNDDKKIPAHWICYGAFLIAAVVLFWVVKTNS